MTGPSLPPHARGYLLELRDALSSLPPNERADILTEVEGHLLDRRARSVPALDAALASFGAPADYATQFGASPPRRDATSARSVTTEGPVLALTARIGAAVLFGTFGLLMTVVTLAELIAPSSAGLFVSAQGFRFGVFDPGATTGMRDVLGRWLLPLGVVGGTLAGLGCWSAVRPGRWRA